MFTASTKLFSYDKATRTFATEFSTLEANVARGMPVPKSFVLISHRTGKAETVVQSHCEYSQDEDCELLAWHFTSVGDIPFDVVIFND